MTAPSTAGSPLPRPRCLLFRTPDRRAAPRRPARHPRFVAHDLGDALLGRLVEEPRGGFGRSSGTLSGIVAWPRSPLRLGIGWRSGFGRSCADRARCRRRLRVLDRLQVGEDRGVREPGPQVVLDRSTRSWPCWTVHAPGTSTWTETNARDPAWRVRSAWKSTPSCSRESVQHGLDPREVAGVEGAVHQPADGAPDEHAAGEDDVDRDGERDQRVEDLPAGQRDGRHADDHARRGPDVGDQVPAVGFQDDRALRRPARSRTTPTPRLISVAPAGTARPRPTLSIGCGSSSRPNAATPMVTAATRTSVPSTPAEKYSAFCARRRAPRRRA